jgi:putative endonuclease
MGLTGARGGAAERLAAAYLELMGERVVARNERVAGVELDLVTREGDVIAIVEVKYRSRMDFGGAALAIDAGKRRRLRRAAQALAADGNSTVRLDVIVLEAEEGGLRLRHVRNAICD